VQIYTELGLNFIAFPSVTIFSYISSRPASKQLLKACNLLHFYQVLIVITKEKLNRQTNEFKKTGGATSTYGNDEISPWIASHFGEFFSKFNKRWPTVGFDHPAYSKRQIIIMTITFNYS
jgi:hypothetical protein